MTFIWLFSSIGDVLVYASICESASAGMCKSCQAVVCVWQDWWFIMVYNGTNVQSIWVLSLVAHVMKRSVEMRHCLSQGKQTPPVGHQRPRVAKKGKCMMFSIDWRDICPNSFVLFFFTEKICRNIHNRLNIEIILHVFAVVLKLSRLCH